MTAMQGEIHGRWTKKCILSSKYFSWLTIMQKKTYHAVALCCVGWVLLHRSFNHLQSHQVKHYSYPSTPSIHSSSFAGVLVTSHSAGRNMAVGWIFSMYKLPSMQCFSFWSHFVSQLEEGALQTNFDLTSSPFPAWGWSNSTGPCPGSSVGRRCHHDQAVGACQGGRLKKQMQKHQDSKKLL